LSVLEKSAKKIIKKATIDVLKTNTQDNNAMIDNIIIEKECVSNNNENYKESPVVENTIIQSNESSSNMLHTHKISSLFSSDEDDLDDTFCNIHNSNTNNIKINQTFSNLENDKNDRNVRSEVKIFDSSSDDDIFSNNNFTSNKNNDKSSLSKIIEPKQYNSYETINQVQMTKVTDEICSTEKNIIDKKNINILNLF